MNAAHSRHASFYSSSSCKHIDAPIISTGVHPIKPFVYAGLSTGQSYQVEFALKPMFSPGVVLSYDLLHNDSCRGILVSEDGSTLFTISADHSIAWTDLETGRPKTILPEAHSASLQSCSFVSSHCIATGDDNGCLRIWDERALGKKASPVMEFKDHIDFISSIQCVPIKKTMITGGGDGYLNVYDLRKNKCKASSDPLEEEILSMALVKEGKRLVCGMQDGSVNIFSWDYWAGPSDRLLGHPSSIDSMIPLTSSIIATGGGDGFIRYLSIQPNSLLGWTAIPHLSDLEDVEENNDRLSLQRSVSPLDIESDDNFWPISTLCKLKNPLINENNDDKGSILVCGSQELLYVTCSHSPFLLSDNKYHFSKSSNREDHFIRASDDDDLDIGTILDTKPQMGTFKKSNSAYTDKSKKTPKKLRTTLGFVEQRYSENAKFFQDLLEQNDTDLDLVNS